MRGVKLSTIISSFTNLPWVAGRPSSPIVNTMGEREDQAGMPRHA